MRYHTRRGKHRLVMRLHQSVKAIGLHTRCQRNVIVFSEKERQMTIDELPRTLYLLISYNALYPSYIGLQCLSIQTINYSGCGCLHIGKRPLFSREYHRNLIGKIELFKQLRGQIGLIVLRKHFGNIFLKAQPAHAPYRNEQPRRQKSNCRELMPNYILINNIHFLIFIFETNFLALLPKRTMSEG